MNESGQRRCCLLSGIGLTLFGCVICALSIALPGWQLVDMPEFSAIHEHGIFYDCVRSDTTPLKEVQKDLPFRSTKKCTYKFDPSASRTVRISIEEGDLAATETLLHRFLPQHKAVIFFFIFTVIFALMSMVVGACSPCFVPNGVLHVISVLTATTCSILADLIFFVDSMKMENRKVQGSATSYHQRLGYAFFVHFFGTLALVAATLCSVVSAYLLIRKEWRLNGCCDSKTVSKHAYNCESYCHYPSLTFYGMPENAADTSRTVDIPAPPIRLPTQNTSNVSSFFAVPTRVEQRNRSVFEQSERLVHEEDV